MSDYSRLIEILQNLVSIRSVSGDATASAACLNYAEKILDSKGLKINRFSSNGFESLVATTHDTKSPTLLLQAHLDVVPGDDSLFTLRRDGDRLLGRGTYDMKYAAACFLHLIEELGPKCADYNLGIMLTTDEEQGGQNGVEYLLRQGYSCQICILPDGGDNWRVETAAKGAWHVDVAVSGKTAHGSRPWDGENAAVKLMAFLGECAELAPVQSHTDTTLAITKLQAGDANNQIPDEACASLDIRYLNARSYHDIHTRLCDLAKKHDAHLTNELHINPIELDVNLPAIQEWGQVVSGVRGINASDGYALSFGASDARYFHAKGIPAIVTRPDGGGMHSDSEWIDEAGLYQFADCLQQYANVIAYEPRS